MIDVKFLKPLQGEYNRAVFRCEFCDNNMLGRIYKNCFGFSELNGKPVILIECDKCFGHFYFHADESEFRLFYKSVEIGENKLFTSPDRIQRKRTKGYRHPEGTFYAGRGTIFGNPFLLKDHTREDAVSKYRAYLDGMKKQSSEIFLKMMKKADSAKHLSCFCKPEDKCHVDVILEFLKQWRDDNRMVLD